MRFRSFLFLCSVMVWGIGASAAAPPGLARGLISASPVYPGRTIPSAAAGRSGAALAERCTMPRGATVCTALVTWSTENASSAVVTVQDTLGGGQVPFAVGVSGNWPAQIQPFPHRYIFRLFDSSSGSLTLLADTTVAASGTGTISGFPNPCTILSGQTSCTSTISWSTQNVTAAQVTVQDVGGSESVFAGGAPGSQNAQILGSPHQYTFRLYDISSGAASAVLLAATTVRATGSTLLLDGAPNPCQIVSGTSCLSRISWATPQSVTSAVVTVQDAFGGGEVDFATTLSGEKDTAIYAPPHKYTFQLYDTTSGSRVLLASTVVVATGTGTIDASPNPCVIPSNGTVCTSTIRWNTQNVTVAEVTVQAVSGGESLFATSSSGTSSKDYTQIAALPQQYTFRLYDASSGSRIWLAGMVVLAQGTGTIDANPNPCQITSGTSCQSRISWTTQHVTTAQVTKQDIGVGGTEENFASSPSTFQDDPQIAAPPHRYDFRLYDASSGTQRFWLQGTTVLAIGTGIISADPNPCQIVSPATSCTTNINWSTSSVGAAEITWEDVSDGTGVEHDCTSGTSGGPLSTSQCQVPLAILAPPHYYIFRLYDISSGYPFLVSLYTVVAKGTGTISALPNPCTIVSGQTTCSSTISWSTQNVTTWVVRVAVKDPVTLLFGPESDFATSPLVTKDYTQVEAPPKQYLFRLYDASLSGNSFWLASRVVSAIVASPPAAPTNLAATAASSSQINLMWTDNSSDEAGFKIERSLDGTTFSLLATVGVNVSTYSDLGLAPSTKYYYRVLAFNSGGNSIYSNIANATTLPSPLAAPTNLAATVASSSQINLAWTDNSGNNEDGFKIESSTDGTTFSQIATVGVNVNTYQNTGLAPGTYYYRVRAFKGADNSAYSNIANATILPSPPAAPSGLTATAGLTGSKAFVDLSWQDNSNNEDNFIIERCLGASCTNFSGIAQVTGTTTTGIRTYRDTTVARKKTYSYRVKAQNAGGSSYSNIKAATTK